MLQTTGSGDGGRVGKNRYQKMYYSTGNKCKCLILWIVTLYQIAA